MSGCFDNTSGIILSRQPECSLGFYCPRIGISEGGNATLPTFCNPSATCAITRLLGAVCEDVGPTFYGGAQGLYEPGKYQQKVA